MSDAPEIQEIYISVDPLAEDNGSSLVCRTTAGVHYRVFDLLPPDNGDMENPADFDEFVMQCGYKKVEAIRSGRIFVLASEASETEISQAPVSTERVIATAM